MKKTKCVECKKIKECIFDLEHGRLCKSCYEKIQNTTNHLKNDLIDIGRGIGTIIGIELLQSLESGEKLP